MKQVYQKILNFERGDCLRACIASIFEIELEEVPEADWTKTGEAWAAPYQKWLAKRNLMMLCVNATVPVGDGGKQWYPKGYSILSCSVLGLKANDGEELRHSVVALDGEIIFDPTPNSDHLRSDLYPRDYYLFVVLDASKL